MSSIEIKGGTGQQVFQRSLRHVNIDVAGNGNNLLVAAAANHLFLVVGIALFATGAVTVTLNDGTADILGGTRRIALDPDNVAGFVLQPNPWGWCRTQAVNRPLNLNLSAAVGVAGALVYAPLRG